MSDETSVLTEQIERLRRRVALLEELRALNQEVDDLNELALRDRLPLDDALALTLPVLRRATGASFARVWTYDDALAMRAFSDGEEPNMVFERIDELAEREGTTTLEVEGRTVIGQRLDVSGESFGSASVLVDGVLGTEERDRVAALLDTWCEEVDNQLASVALARKKTLAVDAMSLALRDPVLVEGLARALEVLGEIIPFRDLLLVFRHEDDLSGRSLQYRVVRDGRLEVDSSRSDVDPEIDTFLRDRAFRLLEGDDREVRERFGVERAREEVMITGVRSARVIGRMWVSSARGEFNTFDRDLLDRFTDALRQRIVDYGREWKQLASTFDRATCERLLSAEGYRDQWLTPRERDCAVMFCDISGFTRLCEQVLVRPAAIGRMVNVWSQGVVDIVWDTGGVFDKMIGDCVVALWGPPFFERPARDLARRAAEAAVRIRALTRALTRHPNLPELAGATLDVATGLSYCSLFVGIFGPDEDFTGFSSGMNNTARLQAQAIAGEIVCMDAFVEAFGDNARFGEERTAEVKNVAVPLRYRPLIGG